MVTIKYNSLYAKLYRFFYVTDVMPKSLCPYFWKQVLATILVIPVIILSAPIYLVDSARNEDTDYSQGWRVGGGLICYIILFLLFAFLCFVSWCIGLLPAKGNWDIIIFIGAIVTLTSIFVFMAYLKERREDKLYQQLDSGLINYLEYQRLKRSWIFFGLKVPHIRDWLVITYLMSWYEKRCPIIEWKK
jgi:hypothetical protein